MLYSTIANNSGTNGGAIDCGPGNVTVRNSIVISSAFANAINCGGGNSVTYSVVRDAEFEGNPTNLPLTDIADLAFDENYSLGAGSVAIDVAQWEEDDPATDINGSARPAVPGTPDDAGADRAGG